MNRETLGADLLLLLVALVWGVGFVAQRVANDWVGPLTFTSLRYWIGAAVLVPILWRSSRRISWRREVRGGLILGVVMSAAAGLQQVGLVTTTASRASFITGLYVLAVPILGLVFGQRARVGHVVGAAVGVLGLVLLSGDWTSGGGLNRGDLLVLGCALLWALHVVLIGQLAPNANPLRLAAVQFVVVGLISGVGAAVFERGESRFGGPLLLPLLYSGVFAIGLGLTLQIVAQRKTPATHAAVIMSLEAVFGAAAGVLMLAERLTPREWVGCGLMLAGCMVSQLWPHRKTRAQIDQLVDPVR